MSEPRAPRESLTAILKIEDRGDGRYEAELESFWGFSTPGDLLARATLAASAGASLAPNAMHAEFFGPATPDTELSFAREELASDCRRVRVRERETLCCDVTLRFGPAAAGLSYQSVAPGRNLPAPEDLPSEVETAEAEGWSQYAVGPIEARRLGVQQAVTGDDTAVWLGWLRPREPLAGDARLHAAALAFLSEYRSHWAVERRLGADFPRSDVILLDHALWVHRAERWDDWWLVKTLTEVGVAGRCFSRREIYARGGALIASAAWEAVVRPRGGS